MTAAIVFDLDGTLIDSAPDICATANLVLSREGVAPLTLDQTRSFIGNGARVLVRRVMTARDIPESELDRLHGLFLELYEDAHALTTLYPGVIGALDQLADRGFVLGICTNKPISPTMAALDHLGLTHRFARVVGGDSLPQIKPDPTPLFHVFEALGRVTRVFVGDSEVDYQTTQAAGVPFALFSGGYRKSDLTAFPGAALFDHHDHLPDLVSGMT
jgi:phosphoglycolate phosphatase